MLRSLASLRTRLPASGVTTGRALRFGSGMGGGPVGYGSGVRAATHGGSQRHSDTERLLSAPSSLCVQQRSADGIRFSWLFRLTLIFPCCPVLTLCPQPYRGLKIPKVAQWHKNVQVFFGTTLWLWLFIRCKEDGPFVFVSACAASSSLSLACICRGPLNPGGLVSPSLTPRANTRLHSHR